MDFEVALSKKRFELDEIDRKIVALYEARMRVCREIGVLKRANGAAVFDGARENALLASRGAMLTDASLEEGLRALFQLLLDQSKALQRAL